MNRRVNIHREQDQATPTYKTAPTPANEAKRLEALRYFGILDTPAEEAFDDITKLASEICNTPIALISLVDTNRQWFKSKVGLNVSETARDIAFCAHAIHQKEILVIPDTTHDSRFAQNPLVVDNPNIRFYAGAPLISSDNFALGTLCVIDRFPRDLSKFQLEALERLARTSIRLIEMFRDKHDLAERISMEAKIRSRVSIATKAANIGVWEWNLKDNSLLWDEEMYRLYGISQNSFHGVYEAWANGLHPDDRERATAEVQKAAKDAGKFDTTFRVVWPSGEIRTIKAYAECRFDKAGLPESLVGVNWDVTKETNAIEKTTSLTAKLQNILRFTPVGIFQTDRTGLCIFTNDRWHVLTGLSEQQAQGDGWASALHPEDRSKVLTEWNQSIHENREFSLEYRFIRPDQSVIHVIGKAVPVLDQNGNVQGYLGSIEDITALKHAMKELKETNELRKAIIDSANYSIIATNPEGLIQAFNRGAEEMLQYSASELVGKYNPGLLHKPNEVVKRAATLTKELGELVEPSFRAFVAKVEKGGADENEWTYIRKDGTSFPVRLSVTMIKTTDGACGGYLGIAHDISRSKALELELAKEKAALERSNQDLEEFAYIASHDLKEPLRGMYNYASFLIEDYADKLDAEGKKKLESINHLGKRMETLIDSLLYFSLVGRTEHSVEVTNLDSVIKDVFDSIHVMLETQNVKVIYPKPLPEVKCDHVRIRELFLNLFTNAIKYNDKIEKTIEIGFETAEKGPVSFFVRDNGIGIPEDQKDAIFKIFKRLHGKDQYGGGSGLGLSVVRKIVERHHGTIWIESNKNEGTTFKFTLEEDTSGDNI